MRTKSAEQKLIAAARTPATAPEAHYWLGRIYDFKGNKAEGAFPGFHEEVSFRPRAEAEFKLAGTPKPEWIAEGEAVENALKAADAALAKQQATPNASVSLIRAARVGPFVSTEMCTGHAASEDFDFDAFADRRAVPGRSVFVNPSMTVPGAAPYQRS